MTEIYGRPHGPRVVRTPEGWILTVGGEAVAELNATDLLWLKESMDAAVRSVLVDVLYGGGRKETGA